MTVNQIIKKVKEATDAPFSWDEVDAAIIELQKELTNPKWAIEDEVLRHELEQLVVSWTVRGYLTEAEQSIKRKEHES